MLKLQQLIRENTKELSALISRETGKPVSDAMGEIGRTLEVVEYACSITVLQQGDFVENAATGVETYSLLQPLGVGAGITAFNFPVMVPLLARVMATVGGLWSTRP